MHTDPTLRTTLFGVAMIMAPLLLLVSTITSVIGEGLGEDQAGGIIQVYAMAGFLLVTIGLTQLLEDVVPRAAAVLTLLGALGVAAGVGYGINAIYTDIGTLDLNNDVEGVAAPLALQLPGILFPLSFLALGVALYRARVQPRWCGLAIALGAVLFPVSRIGSIDVLAPVPDVLFLLGLAPLGWSLVQGRIALAERSPSLVTR